MWVLAVAAVAAVTVRAEADARLGLRTLLVVDSAQRAAELSILASDLRGACAARFACACEGAFVEHGGFGKKGPMRGLGGQGEEARWHRRRIRSNGDGD